MMVAELRKGERTGTWVPNPLPCTGVVMGLQVGSWWSNRLNLGGGWPVGFRGTGQGTMKHEDSHHSPFFTSCHFCKVPHQERHQQGKKLN